MVEVANAGTAGSDAVGDDELLYRRVPDHPAFYAMDDGELRISRNAFQDAGRQPSVERAICLRHAPVTAMTRPDQGIVCILADEVRALITTSRLDKQGRCVQLHRLDVVAAPSPRSSAHAVIVARPPLASPSSFTRVRAQLAAIANKRGWLVMPPNVCQALR